MVQYLGHLRHALKAKGISERELAHMSGVSRTTVRSILRGDANFRLDSLGRLLKVLDGQVTLIAHLQDGFSDCSSIATSIHIHRNGRHSWKPHLMNMVDEFRRTRDVRLLMLAPSNSLDEKMRALMASTVSELCGEVGLETPAWAKRTYFLDKPWFVSGSEALKAMAILESPLTFRRNNIFVHSNFLSRK